MNSVTAYTFWSPICEPCKVIKPSLEALKEDFDSVHWVSVNIRGDAEGLAARFGVTHVPTMVVTVNDQVIGKVVGTAMAEYYRILRQATR
jgi:thiol-disulfide isomerase/thioredoxin